jgi:chaperonin cofactor prefoldin
MGKRMLPGNVDELVKGLKESTRVIEAEGKALDLFRIAYHAATSLKSYCVDFSEKGSEDSSYSTVARLYSTDGSDKTVKQVRVGSDVKGIELKLWSSSKEKADAKTEETVKKIQQTLSSVGKLSGESLQNFHNAVVIERKLDISLNLLLTGATSQKVYFDIADSRERMILLMGRFDPSIIQMENALEELKKLGKEEPVKKEIGEKIALSVLKWKKRIDEYISQLK